MSVSQDELMFLQSQLEGLESIFFELMPFGVELKRQQVQDYYNQRFDQATKPTANVAETELRRQFNTKANQVRNLVDSAESLGDALNKLNLIRAAATLPEQRNMQLKEPVSLFCQNLIKHSTVDADTLAYIQTNLELTPVEARVLLGSVMFLIVDELDNQGKTMPVKDLLDKMLELVTKGNFIDQGDPFMVEAKCILEAIERDKTN